MEQEEGLDLEAVQQQQGQEVLWWCIQGPHLTHFPSGLCVCEGDVSTRPQCIHLLVRALPSSNLPH